MSRLIKRYPYVAKYQDTMEAYAASVCLLTVLALEFSVIKNGTIYQMRAKTSFKAYEDKQGVFISFINFEVKKDDWVLEKKIKTTEFYYDEVEVCDAVYNAVSEGRSVMEDVTLLDIRDKAAIAVIPSALKKEGYEIWYP